MIYAIYPCPVSFCPLDSFCPPPISFCPLSFAPPGNLLMYTIFPFLYHIAPYHFAPYHFAPPPLKLFHDLRYLPMSRIILPPWIHFAPWKSFDYTIFPFPYHFPLSFCPHIILPLPPWKLFHDLHYLPMSSIILPPGLFLPPYHFAPIILTPPP